MPETTLQALINAGAIVVRQPSPVYPPMFWRFLVNDVGAAYERYIVRDCDSRISMREVDAVNQWIESGKQFHILRDHPAHARPINGGMWGAVAGCIPKITDMLDAFKPTGEYHQDSDFLAKWVWPMVKDKAIQHDSFSASAYPGSFPFPTKRKDQKDFVGSVFEVAEDGTEFSRPGDFEQITDV